MSQKSDILVNRVANSGLITINPEDFLPSEEIIALDIAQFLFQGLILKEKDFRMALKEFDWGQYQNKVLTVHCSTDAIIPLWAFMLITVNASSHAHEVFLGTREDYITEKVNKAIRAIRTDEYEGKRVVIKGCGEKWVPSSAYLELTNKLQPVVQSLMYGEPCSTVPIFKRPRKV